MLQYLCNITITMESLYQYEIYQFNEIIIKFLIIFQKLNNAKYKNNSNIKLSIIQLTKYSYNNY